LVPDLRDGKFKRGMCIILDESGSAFSSREAQTRRNKRMAKLLQIFRDENLCLIMTLPHLGFLDKTGRLLMDGNCTTMSMNRKKKLCKMRFVYTWYNEKVDKLYEKFLRVKDRDGNIKIVKNIIVKKPSDKTSKEYKRLKKLNKKNEYTGMIEESNGSKKVDKPGVPLVCKNGHAWNYTGDHESVQCPRCNVRVKVMMKNESPTN